MEVEEDEDEDDVNSNINPLQNDVPSLESNIDLHHKGAIQKKYESYMASSVDKKLAEDFDNLPDVPGDSPGELDGDYSDSERRLPAVSDDDESELSLSEFNEWSLRHVELIFDPTERGRNPLTENDKCIKDETKCVEQDLDECIIIMEKMKKMPKSRERWKKSIRKTEQASNWQKLIGDFDIVLKLKTKQASDGQKLIGDFGNVLKLKTKQVSDGQGPENDGQEDYACGYDEEDLDKNKPGKVLKVTDRDTNKVFVEKKIPLADFSDSGVRCWLRLAQNNMAPKLYRVLFWKKFVLFTMEYITGDTLQAVIGKLTDDEDAKTFSFLLLHFLLRAFNCVMEIQGTFSDLRRCNVMVTPQPDFRFCHIDFDLDEAQANRPYLENTRENIQDIISLFFCSYTGCKDGDFYKNAVPNELREKAAHLSPNNKKALFTTIETLEKIRSEDIATEIENLAKEIEKEYLEPTPAMQLPLIKDRLRSICFPQIHEKDLKNKSDDSRGVTTVDERPANIEEQGFHFVTKHSGGLGL